MMHVEGWEKCQFFLLVFVIKNLYVTMSRDASQYGGLLYLLPISFKGRLMFAGPNFLRFRTVLNERQNKVRGSSIRFSFSRFTKSESFKIKIDLPLSLNNLLNPLRVLNSYLYTI